MPRVSRTLLTIAGFTLATWATAMDGPLPVPADGVKLEAPTTTSPNVRLVIPAEEIEKRAQAEYKGIIGNAAHEGALAPDNVPDLIRIRAIVKRLTPQAPRWNPDAAHWQRPVRRTYISLLASVDAAAQLLHDNGVRRHDAVALLSPNCDELITATLAAQTAGVAAPVNSGLATEQIVELIGQLGATVLIAAGYDLPETKPVYTVGN